MYESMYKIHIKNKGHMEKWSDGDNTNIIVWNTKERACDCYQTRGYYRRLRNPN